MCGAKPSGELPAKARLRVTVQWREPHEPSFFGDPGDPYRLNPLAALRLMVLRQLELRRIGRARPGKERHAGGEEDAGGRHAGGA